MKMTRSTFVKTNKFLPLLTDTLPYETPILFSNRGFYANLSTYYNKYYNDIIRKKAKGEPIEQPKTIEAFFYDCFFAPQLTQLRDAIFGLKPKVFIPYRYKVAKAPQKQRTISLIHPISQIQICDLYNKYEQEILYYTSNTNVSLRHPAKKVTKTFRRYTSLINKMMQNDATDEDNEIDDLTELDGTIDVSSIPTNYFVNKKFRFLYKFYESNDLLKLEQRFEKCIKFDIKQCFDNIYTHSVSWAIKGKLFSKQKKKKQETFEAVLDAIMRNSNWGETHGIPIGSEFSRIFAEIILQAIDRAVEKRLIDSKIAKISYKIQRYVDDYFLFFNNDDIAETIIDMYKQELMEYKLFLNSEKTIPSTRPFITQQNFAKQELRTKINRRLKLYHTANPGSEKIKLENLFHNANKLYLSNSLPLVKEVRQIIANNHTSVFDVSGFIFGLLKKDTINILNILKSVNTIPESDSERIIKGLRKYLVEVLELAFYIFQTTTRASNTFGICKVCFIVIEMLRTVGDQDLSDKIYQHIYSEFLIFLENKAYTKGCLIEYLDILWILKQLEPSYKLSAERLKAIIEDNNDNFSYFPIMMTIAYIGADSEYAEIKSILLAQINKILKNESQPFYKADLFMMFFDIISCPFIDEADKMNILQKYNIHKNLQAHINWISNHTWFFGWNEKINITTILKIKELHSAY